MIRVKCVLRDCAYYNSPSGAGASSTECDCAHPDKSSYTDTAVCPLYKKDWMSMSSAGDISHLKKRRR